MDRFAQLAAEDGFQFRSCLAQFAEHDTWIPVDTAQVFGQTHPAVSVHTDPAHHGFGSNQRGAWNGDAAQHLGC